MKKILLLLLFVPIVAFGQNANDYDKLNGIKFIPPSDFTLTGKLFWVNNKRGETLRIVSTKIPEKFYRKDFYGKVISYDKEYVKNTISFDYEGDDWVFNRYNEFELSGKTIHFSFFYSIYLKTTGQIKSVYASVKEDRLFTFFVESSCLNSDGNLTDDSIEKCVKRSGFIFANTHIPLL